MARQRLLGQREAADAVVAQEAFEQPAQGSDDGGVVAALDAHAQKKNSCGRARTHDALSNLAMTVERGAERR